MKSLASPEISSALSDCLGQSARRGGVIVGRPSAKRVVKILSFLTPLLFLVFVTSAQEVRGQVTFDAASSANTGSGTAGSLTWSHTVGAAGTNRILIVGVSIRNSGGQTVSSVTYAGAALTLVGVIPNSTNARVEIWRRLAPATGANNIIVTLSANARFVGGASSFTGVHQTTPLGAFFSNTGNSPTPTVTVTGVAANEVVIDTIANANLDTAVALPCVGAGQTQRWSNRTTSGSNGNNTPGAGSTEPGPAGGGNVTMSWTLQGCAGSTNRQWASGAVALKPAVVASISATDAGAAETRPSQVPNTGTFTVTLAAAPPSNVTINYTVTGTATNGTDYTLLTGTLTILSGLTSGTITVTPTDDSAIEGFETVIVTLNAGAGYTVGTPNNATVTITDNDKEWDGGAGTANWVDAANWDNNTAPNSGDNILFGANVPANVTVSMGAPRTIGNLTFDTARTVTLGSGATTLTVDGDTITVAQATPTIAAPITLSKATTVSVAGGATLNSSAAISGGFGITKTGAGTLRLSGTNTYTGSTTVSAGTLVVNGSTSSSSAVTVNSGATLSGTGTASGTLTIGGGGTLAPGDSSASTLGTGALTLNNTTTLNYDLGTVSDLTSVNGNLTLDGTLNVTAAAGFGVGTYRLFNYTGTLTNNTLVTGTMPAGYTYQISTSTAGQVNLIVSAYTISGTVFEDVNYGGGGGRSLVSSSGVVRANARVELYNASGNFVSFTTTNAAGVYTFSGQLAANYSVRVVNSTVTSSRPGSVGTLISVQTFRTDASTGTAVADANRVGGEEPSKVDAAANTTSATLASLTTGTTTAQSISPVTISGSNVTGVDFGFNFDTVVNINNTGQGSLRQFITNSNALTNGGLAQAGFAAGVETSIFMISDGVAHSGLRAGLVNQLTGGVASIAPTSLLPQITDANTVIDGSTQTTNVGNTNSGALGAGGTVGVDGLSLQTVNRPEVQIVDNGGLAIGLDAQANSVTVRGLAIYGFGTAANNDSHGNIRIGNNFTGTLIEQNVLGSNATSFTDPGAGARSVGDNIRSAGGDSGVVRNNLIGFSAGKGIQLGGGATGWLIEGNEVRNNGIGNSNLDGIDIENGSGGNTVRGNSFSANEAAGIDMYQSSGGNTVENNTLTGNGIGPSANVETPGVRLYGAGNMIDRNIINANIGAGVLVTSGSTGNLITRNSIYGNGPTNSQIGIDLLSATDNQLLGSAPFVTVNDSGDGDTGGNNRLNFPVVLTATVLAGNLTLTGYALPGSTIELYIAAVDPGGFGEGQTYLVTLVEGSAADTDATTGTYTNPVNGLNQGTDTTNKFSFTIPTPGGVSAGTILTATATLGGSTSEFSGNVTVTAAPDLTITKSHSGNFTVGVNGTYTLTASNAGSLATSGTITVTDNLPTGLTVAALPTGTGWDCSTTVVGSSTATCTSSDVIAAGATSPNPITLTVVVSPAAFAASPVTNVANISGGSEPASNNGNNSASDPTTIDGVADLTIAKSHTGNFTVGVNGTYTLTASNPGTLATSGTITVTDNLPTGLTVAALPTGTGWDCSTTVIGSSTATCTSSDVIAAGATSPNPITLTVVVSPAAFAASPVTNVANISGGGEPAYNNANNSASDPTTIDGVADLTIAKSHSGNFTVGVNGTYTLTASNPGTLATSGTITVTDNLPTGLTVAAIPTGTGWDCSTTVIGSSTATCTSSDVIAAGATSPNPITLTVVVSPAAFAASPVTNVANISGGGEPAYNNSNNSASDPTTINGVADLTITKTHTGNFTVGVNGTYTLTASNPGTLATSGTITVTDNLPTGLTVAAIPTGTGWDCSTTVIGSSTATCTSSDVIAAGATSPNPITLTVVVSPAAFAASPVTNVANISGGGEPAYNNGDNSASDPTTINGVPDLTITKTHTGNFTQGQTNAIYSITATNSGTAITSGTVTVTDTLPSGLTATGISGAGWSCVLGTLTCTRNDALAAGASYPVITLTVDVSLTAPASVTNSATISGGGENNASNNTASDLTTIDVAAPPSVGLLKSVSPGGSQIPGGDLLYTIVYTNTGGQPATNFVIVDPNMANPVPAERVFRDVDFKIGSMTSSPGSTGLVATFEYSNDGGTTWTYTPVSGGGGAPAGYDRVVTNIRWSFAGSLSQTAPNNTGSVELTVRIR